MEKIHMQRADDNNNYDNKSKYGKDPSGNSYNYNNAITIINQPTYEKNPYAKSLRQQQL